MRVDLRHGWRKSITSIATHWHYNTLDAHFDACKAYIDSQRHAGWHFKKRYDDGGYSGANLQRPGFQQLLADVDAKRIDCIVVYKVDRLSRSLADFTQLMARFDANGIRFVSITQHFNTATSMGEVNLKYVVVICTI